MSKFKFNIPKKYLEKTYYTGIFLFSLACLDRIFYSRLRIRFLILVSGVSFSLLALIFGINAVTIEQFINPDTAYKYDFTQIKNILNFPLDQYKAYNGTAKSIKELVAQKSAVKKVGKHILIVDKTVSIANDTSYNADLIKVLKYQDYGPSYEERKIKDKDPRALLIDYSFRLINNSADARLYYLKPATTDESLVVSDYVENCIEGSGRLYGNGFIGEIHNEIEDISQNGKTYFSKMLSELKVQLENDSSEVLNVVILSDFLNEDQDKKEFLTSLRQINAIDKEILWSFIQLPHKDKSGSEPKYDNVNVNDFLNDWYKISPFNLIRLSDVLRDHENDQRTKFLFPKEKNQVDHEVLNIIYPATIKDLNNVASGYGYDEANRHLNLSEGKYILTFYTQAEGLQNPLPVEYSYKQNSRREIILNNTRITVDHKDIIVSLNSEGSWGHIGNLRVNDLENNIVTDVPVWKKRRLNKTGIWYYLILMHMLIVSVTLFTISFFLPALCYSNKQTKSIPWYGIVLFTGLVVGTLMFFFCHLELDKFYAAAYHIPFTRTSGWLIPVVLIVIVFILTLADIRRTRNMNLISTAGTKQDIEKH